MLRKLLKIIIALIIITAGLTALIVIQETRRVRKSVSIERIQQEEGMPVAVTRPEKRSFTDYLHTDGEITAEHRTVLRSRIAETVENIQVRIGDKVRAGETVIEFRKDDLETAVEARETAVKEAENNYQRYVSLNEKGHVTLQQLEQRKTALENARLALRRAETKLNFAVIKSPVTGFVEQRRIEPGEFASSGALLLSIIDPLEVAVRATVPSDFIARVKTGMQAEFRVEGTDSWQQAEVTRIRPSTDNPNRFFDVYIDLDNTDSIKQEDNLHLRPGMYVESRFPKNTFRDIPAVPKECLRQLQGQYFVYGVKQEVENVPLADKPDDSGQKPDGLPATVRWAVSNYMDRWGGEDASPEEQEDTETKSEEVLKAVRIAVTPGIQDDGCIQIKESEQQLPEYVILNPHEDLQDGQKIEIVRRKGED